MVQSNSKALFMTDEQFAEYRRKTFILKTGHTSFDYEQFLDALNFTYDSGYGGQELFGTVWLTNNEWLERGEYHGSEWWEHRVHPKIPDDLLAASGKEQMK